MPEFKIVDLDGKKTRMNQNVTSFELRMTDQK